MDTACSDLTAGFQEFQARLQKTVQATQSAQQELKQERAKLAEEREAFAEERNRVQQVVPNQARQQLAAPDRCAAVNVFQSCVARQTAWKQLTGYHAGDQ